MEIHKDLNSTKRQNNYSMLIVLFQLLVMGNEETLGGFPVKQAVPALVSWPVKVVI